jgi:threonine/homoserine/homoserine lactone efflux protein
MLEGGVYRPGHTSRVSAEDGLVSPEFLLTSLIVVVMPGTGVIYTLSCGLFQGRAASIAAAFGCTLGILPPMAASMLGLAALLHASAVAFQAVKLAGVAYLLYLAWQMWREATPPRLAEPETSGGSGGLVRVSSRGFLINILNPKLSIFFLAFLPQFTPAGAVDPLWVMARHSAVFMAMTLVIFVLYGMCAALARERMMSSPKLMRWMRRSFAGLFAALGLRLALTER